MTAWWLLAGLFLGRLSMGEHLPLGYRPRDWEIEMLASVRAALRGKDRKR